PAAPAASVAAATLTAPATPAVPARSGILRSGGATGASRAGLAHRSSISLGRAGLAQAASPAEAQPGSTGPIGLRARQPAGVRVEARSHAQLLLDLLLDLVGEVGVLEQVFSGVLLALPQLVALVCVPGTGLAHDRLLDTKVDQPALFANSKTEKNIEFCCLEWGCAVVDDYILRDQVVQVLHFHVERAAAS